MYKKIIKPAKGSKKNSIATLLTFFAIVMFAGGLYAGALLAQQETGYRTETVFVWPIALEIWATTFFAGLIFISVAEIIRLLQLKQTQEYEIVEQQVESSTTDTK